MTDSSLKRIRKHRKLTQRQLGDMTGYSSTSVGRFELGEAPIPKKFAIAAAAALQTPEDILFADLRREGDAVAAALDTADDSPAAVPNGPAPTSVRTPTLLEIEEAEQAATDRQALTEWTQADQIRENKERIRQAFEEAYSGPQPRPVALGAACDRCHGRGYVSGWFGILRNCRRCLGRGSRTA